MKQKWIALLPTPVRWWVKLPRGEFGLFTALLLWGVMFYLWRGVVFEGASPLDIIAKLAAVAALLFSFYNFSQGRLDRSHDRRRKIHDEFWIQKVVYPTIIEPILKSLQGVAAGARGFGTPPHAPSVEALFNRLSDELSDLRLKLGMLNIFDGDLYRRVWKAMEAIEDATANLLATVVYEDQAQAAADMDCLPDALMTPGKLVAAASDLMKEVVGAVVDAQTKL